MSLAEELLLLTGYEFIYEFAPLFFCIFFSNYILYLDGNCWCHNAISSGNHPMQNALHHPLPFGCFETTDEVSWLCRKSTYGISSRLTHRQYSEHYVSISFNWWHGHRFVADSPIILNNLSNSRSVESFGIECGRLAKIPETILSVASERSSRLQEEVQERVRRNK